MKTSNKILLGVAAIAVVGLVVYASRSTRRKDHHEMLEQIADEGYETAHDVLFPDNQRRNRKLQYGPVLPS